MKVASGKLYSHASALDSLVGGLATRHFLHATCSAIGQSDPSNWYGEPILVSLPREGNDFPSCSRISTSSLPFFSDTGLLLFFHFSTPFSRASRIRTSSQKQPWPT